MDLTDAVMELPVINAKYHQAKEAADGDRKDGVDQMILHAPASGASSPAAAVGTAGIRKKAAARASLHKQQHSVLNGRVATGAASRTSCAKQSSKARAKAHRPSMK
jgi:hypothetical protein